MININPLDIYQSDEENENEEQPIEIAEVYTGPEEYCPDAIVINEPRNDNESRNDNEPRNNNEPRNDNEEERITFCEREEAKETLCIIFIILLIFFGYIIYISV